MSSGKGFAIKVHQTGAAQIIEDSSGKLSISIPCNVKRCGGRRLITLPDGSAQKPRPWDTEPIVLQLALTRGHRWLQMLESGEVRSLKEIAAREKADYSYVSRMANLTVLAPDIIATILDDNLPTKLTLFDLAEGPPRLWREQRQRIGMLASAVNDYSSVQE